MLDQFVKIWDGGIVLYGSVIGGLVSYAIAYCAHLPQARLSTLKLADILAPCLAVGLCLGRFGCFLNGCCYGQVACPDCPVSPSPSRCRPRRARGWSSRATRPPAGFTLAKTAADSAPCVDRVEPHSAAAAAGLQARRRDR